MSNRDSLGVGDLLPQDVIHVFAQEKHSKRGRKKRTRSLSRAFGWLKRKKRKSSGSNGQNHGMGPALDLALDGHRAGHHGGHKGGQKSGRQTHQHGKTHVVPKLDDDDKTPAPPQFQENVFIESSRSKYVEDLHTEALEGLKMMQQEENSNGVEFQDNESTVSTVTVQTDGESGGFVTDSTIPDTSSVVSRQSSVSARSSRSGLTRQGSTFRPLNSGKKSEKNKTRRRHRRTVAGIPRHVQKELGLDRVGWTMTQQLDEEQLYSGDADNSPVTDGPEQGAKSAKKTDAIPQASNIIHPLSREKVAQLNAAHAAQRDDLALLHRLNPHSADEGRPRSLAMPWMTTASSLLQKPPSPVMTMSPQATYMSKIIPNAVLPPSIDVVEISRGGSRSSVRTVSKSSLLLSSPAPSRASSRASSSRTTSSNITSASRYNGPNLSDTSCWSTSESSETLVSDSSTISSSSTPRQKMSHDVDTSAKDKANSNSSNGTFNTKVLKGEQKDGQFARSLSVIKPKKAPPPPNRSNSLHSNRKQRLGDLAQVALEPSVLSKEKENRKPGSSPVPSTFVDSPGYHGDTSSLDDSTGSTLFTFNKSSLLAPKVDDSITNAATDCKGSEEKRFQKNKQSGLLSPSSGYSSQDATSPQQPPSTSPKHKKGFLTKLQKLFAGSTAASLAPSLPTQPEVAEKANSTCEPKHDTLSVSPSVQTLRELFNIPPPPKVHAPPAPPPEVWAHSKRTFELLLGPPAPDNVYAIIKKNPKDRRQQRQSPSVSREGSVKSFVVERKHKNTAVTANESLVAKKVQESGILNHKEKIERLSQNGDLKGNSKEEKVRVCDMLNGMLVKAVEKREERLAVMREEKGHKTYSQATEEKKNTSTLTTIPLVKISSSSSPPLVDGALQPTAIQTTKASTSVQVVSPESSWPPPPSPLAQVSISRTDALDFPFPPPSFFVEEGLISAVQVPPNVPTSGGNLSSGSVFVRQEEKGEPFKVTAGAELQQIVAPAPGIPPPPPYTAPPPPTTETEKGSLPPKKSVSTCKEVPHLLPAIEVSTVPSKDFTTLHSKETSQFTEKTAPLSIPPPPPLPTQVKQEIDPPKKNIPLKPVTKDLPNSILIPHPSPPPPPPLESLLKPSTDDSGSDEAPILPPSEFRNAVSLNETEELAPTKPIGVPLPPPLPAQVPASSTYKSGPLSIEKQHQVTTCASDVRREQTNVITPSLLKMVKLRSIDNSPEPHEAQDQTSSKGVHEEPPSIVTSSNLQIVKLRSVNNSPEPPEVATGVKEEAIPSFLQEVKLRSINNSPEPAEAAKDATKESMSNDIPSSLQTAKLLANNSPEPSKVATGIKEEVTQSFPQKVELQANNSPKPLEAQEQPKPEAPVNQHLPNKELPTSSSSSEAPQKPIRKSLIMSCPTSTSPPAPISSQPTVPQSQSVVVPPTTLPTVVSPMKKSPPATASFGSMNLQEAIRLRTAARSKQGPAFRLSPLGPIDYLKSPTSTASFIFSKSNKKAVIETKQRQEEKENVQNNVDDLTMTKVTSEGESKMGEKVPPPVAKKPKTKGKEAETSDAVEQTAGQEAQQDGLKDATEEINRTAGTVKDGT